MNLSSASMINITQAPSPVYPQCAVVVRGTIHSARRHKGLWIPCIILTLNLAVYFGSFLGIVAASQWWLKALFIIINGHVIGTLFTVGHDACHDSFTRNRFLNGLIGRLAFLPSLTPFTPWRYTHNYLHHSYTNCQDKDFVWRPLSVAEYRTLPWYQRWLERSYRTLPGLALNWIVENWLKWHLFPNRAARTQMAKWGTPTIDRLLVVGWFVLELAAVGVLTWLCSESETLSAAAVAMNVACCVVGPFLIWSALISYIDLLHHTHPKIRWFKNSSEPAFSDTQLEGTTHIVYPFPLGIFYHNIMEHTAHHVDPAIPMYHLRQAQSDLHSAHPDRIVVEFFSLRYVLRILRKCKLYDYTNHHWVGYDGLPTTPSERT